MSKKHRGGPAPVPPGNRPQGGNANDPANEDQPSAPPQDGTGFEEQDPQRRLGDFTGKGEHSIQQPGPRNGGGQSGHQGRSKK